MSIVYFVSERNTSERMTGQVYATMEQAIIQRSRNGKYLFQQNYVQDSSWYADNSPKMVDIFSIPINDNTCNFIIQYNYEIDFTYHDTDKINAFLYEIGKYVKTLHSDSSISSCAWNYLFELLIARLSGIYDKEILSFPKLSSTLKHILIGKYFKYINHDHWINSALDKIVLTEEDNDYIELYKNPVSETNPIYGYKAFIKNPDGSLTCRNFRFNLDLANVVTDGIYPCVSGFHFCKKKVNIPNYYPVDKSYVVIYKVAAWGVVMHERDKIVCSHLKILHKVRKPQL